MLLQISSLNSELTVPYVFLSWGDPRFPSLLSLSSALFERRSWKQVADAFFCSANQGCPCLLQAGSPGSSSPSYMSLHVPAAPHQSQRGFLRSIGEGPACDTASSWGPPRHSSCFKTHIYY